MEYDELIELSIRKAVTEVGQADQLSEMLVKLFWELSSGNELLDDNDESRRRSELLYGATLRNGDGT